VKTAAETFVANPKLDVAKAISQLRVGEALVSTLQENGVPMPVERVLMAPPRLPHGDDHRRRTCGDPRAESGWCEIRPFRQSRISVRDPDAAKNGVGGARSRGAGSHTGGEAGRRHAARLAVGNRSTPGNGGVDGPSRPRARSAVSLVVRFSEESSAGSRAAEGGSVGADLKVRPYVRSLLRRGDRLHRDLVRLRVERAVTARAAPRTSPASSDRSARTPSSVVQHVGGAVRGDTRFDAVGVGRPICICVWLAIGHMLSVMVPTNVCGLVCAVEQRRKREHPTNTRADAYTLLPSDTSRTVYSPGVIRCAVVVPAFMIQTPPPRPFSGSPIDACVAPGHRDGHV
jgi:hypothetical protein